MTPITITECKYISGGKSNILQGNISALLNTTTNISNNITTENTQHTHCTTPAHMVISFYVFNTAFLVLLTTGISCVVYLTYRQCKLSNELAKLGTNNHIV